MKVAVLYLVLILKPQSRPLDGSYWEVLTVLLMLSNGMVLVYIDNATEFEGIGSPRPCVALAAGVHFPQTAVMGGAKTGEPLVFRHQQRGSCVSLWHTDVPESTDDNSKNTSS